MIRFLLGKPSSGPRMTSTSSAAWLYCRMHGGTIAVRTHLRGPRTSLCFLDDPVTFAINEDHAPKIRSCKDRPLCEAGESGEGTFGFEYFVSAVTAAFSESGHASAWGRGYSSRAFAERN